MARPAIGAIAMTGAERTRRYRERRALRPMVNPDEWTQRSLVIRCQDLEQRLTDAEGALRACESERDRYRGEAASTRRQLKMVEGALRSVALGNQTLRDELAKVIQDAWLSGHNGAPAIRKADLRMLRKVVHPDGRPRAKDKTRAAQILNALNFKVC